MTKITVKVKQIKKNRFFATSVTATPQGGGKIITKKISRAAAGELFELEIGAEYVFVANLREEGFQNAETDIIPITASTKGVIVPVPIMGEECRIWLEDIKRMIEKGEHKKAKREIQLAKRVYKHLNPPVPEEVVRILELEKEIPGV